MRTGSIALVGALLGYLLFWPVPIDPIPWKPPPSPGFTGPYAKNEALADANSSRSTEGKDPRAWLWDPTDTCTQVSAMGESFGSLQPMRTMSVFSRTPVVRPVDWLSTL
jgi:hypothetical protein